MQGQDNCIARRQEEKGSLGNSRFSMWPTRKKTQNRGLNQMLCYAMGSFIFNDATLFDDADRNASLKSRQIFASMDNDGSRPEDESEFESDLERWIRYSDFFAADDQFRKLLQKVRSCLFLDRVRKAHV